LLLKVGILRPPTLKAGTDEIDLELGTAIENLYVLNLEIFHIILK